MYLEKNKKFFNYLGILLIIMLGFLFLPSAQKLTTITNHSLEFIDKVNLYLMTTSFTLFVVLILKTNLNNLLIQTQKVFLKRCENDIFNYLNSHKEKETKEFLLKIKLIQFYHNLPIDNLFSNLNFYLNEIQKDSLDENQVRQISQIIMYEINSNFLKNNHDLLEKSLDELKLLIMKKMAQDLKAQRDNNKLLDQFIDEFTDENNLFQKEKILNANL